MQSYRVVVIISVILALAIIALYVHFFVFQKSPEPEKTALTARSESEPPPLNTKPGGTADKKPLQLAELPPLNQSDDFLRKSLIPLSKTPEFKAWLTEKDIIKRIVAVVNNLANGESPAVHLSFLKPPGEFQVIFHDKRTILDPNNYLRNDRIISVFESLSSDSLIGLYLQLEPLFDQAYRNLGYPKKKFRPALLSAIEVLLETPIVEPPIYLEKKVISYAYKDGELENLNPAHKFIMRLGPDNILKIKKKCRQISSSLKAHLE